MATIKTGDNGRMRILDIEMDESSNWSSTGKSLHVRVRFATATSYDRDVRRMRFDSYQDKDYEFTGKHPLKDGDLGDLMTEGSNYSDSDNARLYGENLGYMDVYRITSGVADRMSKTLRHIEKALEARRQEEGYHTSFGQYVARVGNVTGCAGARISVPDSLKSEWASDNYRYCYTVGDVVYELNTLVERWWKQFQTKAEEVAS